MRNSYSIKDIRNAWNKMERGKTKESQYHNNTRFYIGIAYIPYIKGISEHLAKILMKVHIKIFCLPLNKLN